MRAWWLVLLVSGCSVAPREVRVVAELGADQVEVTAELIDLRTSERDPLQAVRAVVGGAEALSAVRLEKGLSWLTGVTVTPRAGEATLDVVVRGKVDRQTFDRCARTDITREKLRGACEDFPLRLDGAGYTLRERKAPLGELRWPAGVARIEARVPFGRADARFLDDGPSLLDAYRLYARTPTVAAAAVAQADALRAAHFASSPAAWLDALDALERCTAEPWCELQWQTVRALQLGQVHGYLMGASDESGDDLRPPPSSNRRDAHVQPQSRLPPIEELRLRVLYDIALDRQGPTGALPELRWRAVCRADVARQPSQRDFCARLGVRL